MNAKLATPEEFAQFLGVDDNKIKYWRKRKIGPAPLKLDRVTFRYLWKDIYAWAARLRAEGANNGQ